MAVLILGHKVKHHILGVWNETLLELEYLKIKLGKFHGIKQENLSKAQIEAIKDLRAQCVEICYTRYSLIKVL